MNPVGASLVRYGFTAGAEGAGAIYPVAAGEAHALATAERSAPVTIDAALLALRAAGARFALAEFADSGELVPLRAVIEGAGFAEVGRVTGFVRDGVDLLILRCDFRESESEAASS